MAEGRDNPGHSEATLNMLYIYSRPPLQDFGGSFLNFQIGKNAGSRAGTCAQWPRARGVGHLVPERRRGFSHRSPTRELRTIEAPSWEGRGSYFSPAASELPGGCNSDGKSRQWHPMPLALLEAFPVGQGLDHLSSWEWTQL